MFVSEREEHSIILHGTVFLIFEYIDKNTGIKCSVEIIWRVVVWNMRQPILKVYKLTNF